jgi:uncharacterized protein YbaP (TraB family)
MGRWLLIPVLAGAMFCAPARADDTTPAAAHPAFWTVHGKSGTAYILSSVHVLPRTIAWHTPAIDDAAKSSSTFLFEVPSGQDDEADATRFIVARGRLPEGERLSSLLSPAAQKDYAAACALAGMQTTALDDKRPWVAAVVLTVSYMYQRHLDSSDSPDSQMLSDAARSDKTIRYFDTTDEQLEFLARFDTTKGLAGFSALVGDFPSQPEREDALIRAWSAGDTATLAKLLDTSFESDPEGRKLIDARNRLWADRLEDLLEEGRTYFVTVGVAHLVGPNGLPALLRSDGYAVDGP